MPAWSAFDSKSRDEPSCPVFAAAISCVSCSSTYSRTGRKSPIVWGWMPIIVSVRGAFRLLGPTSIGWSAPYLFIR
ncbi:Uncharacterised protein [uncultured archaeon]|nr:Uncharacterised protein [uncultured archaeon]